MSIDPVTAINPAADSASGATPVRQSGEAPDPRPSRRSISGTKPTVETPSGKLTSPAPEMPQDEVEVQRANDGSGDIVIRYMDPNGNLILQIPSSQVLGLARAIEHALEEQASRAANGTENSLSSPGGTSHGY